MVEDIGIFALFLSRGLFFPHAWTTYAVVTTVVDD